MCTCVVMCLFEGYFHRKSQGVEGGGFDLNFQVYLSSILTTDYDVSICHLGFVMMVMTSKHRIFWCQQWRIKIHTHTHYHLNTKVPIIGHHFNNLFKGLTKKSLMFELFWRFLEVYCCGSRTTLYVYSCQSVFCASSMISDLFVEIVWFHFCLKTSSGLWTE